MIKHLYLSTVMNLLIIESSVAAMLDIMTCHCTYRTESEVEKDKSFQQITIHGTKNITEVTEGITHSPR